MLGEHPEKTVEQRYDFGCAWYSDHGPFYSNLQIAWFLIGVPCLLATVASMGSACGLTCAKLASAPTSSTVVHVVGRPVSTFYGPLIDVSEVQLDVESDVHRWVSRGAYGAILYGVLLAILAVFITLHANNEAEFSFLVDAIVAAAMCASKVLVTVCARTVHRHLSPLSRQIAKGWVSVLAFSKGLTAACALVLVIIYLALAFSGVDVNRGDGARRLLQEHNETYYFDEDSDHAPTPEEQAQLCKAGFFMLWSFLTTLASQSVAALAFFRIYEGAVSMYDDPFIFSKVVSCWWGILVIATSGVGVALWLGCAICVFPALDISPLRMMGLFYSCAAVSQILAAVAMLQCNQRIRDYWVKRPTSASQQHAAPLTGGAQGEQIIVGQPVELPRVQLDGQTSEGAKGVE
eukprot:TRINITY_DN115051_c0_g1_i1.p1 TRINITY_DN115051_c0_g1~~TRINITY_DN115051_c0_g1_i1.p1  ORF type:complete len:405 (+),score=36.70 TRINITY_DN115051_c0_g1_i1:75-1289(+)